MKSYKALFFIVPLLFISACVIHVQEQHLLHPWKAIPISDEVQRKTIEITTPDSNLLRGWHLTTPKPRATVILFYGNAASLYGLSVRLMQWVTLFNINIICIDYRGYGISGGIPSLSSLREDSRSVFDQTVHLRSGLPTIVLAHSIGAIPACFLASERSIDGLALLAPLSRFQDVASAIKQLGPWYTKPLLPFIQLEPGFKIDSYSEPLDRITKIHTPLLVIHGTMDKIVPYRCGEDLFAASPSEHKNILLIPKIDHNDLDLLVGADHEAFDKFLSSICK